MMGFAISMGRLCPVAAGPDFGALIKFPENPDGECEP
jgi:hypothetical protein